MNLAALKTGASSALEWLKAHPRAAVAIALLVAFCAGRLTKRCSAPTISAKQVEQSHQQAAEHHEAQVATQAQQSTAANSTEKLDEQLHAHVHQVERITPRGSKVITTDTTFDDDLHLEEAEQVSVVVNFAQLTQVAAAGWSTTDVRRESTVTQTAAAVPRLSAALMAGPSMKGTTFAGEGGVRLAGPLWLQGEVLVGGGGVAGLLGARFEW